MKKRDETAAAAVEFALVLPILVAFLFGIIASGVIFAQDLALGNSARQAARFGVMEGHTRADLMREIDDSARSASTTPMTSPASRSPGTAPAPAATRAHAPARPRATASGSS